MASLCSISYEVVLARFISIILDNEVLGQSITIAVFLFGMGLGSLLYKKQRNVYKSLFKLELTIALFAAILPLIILIIITFLDAHFLIRSTNLTTYRYDIVFSFIEFFVLILGVLTGFELPLFLELGKDSKWKISTEKILFLNYLGSLFSIIFIYMFLELGINSLQQIIYFSIYNSFILIFISFMTKSFSHWYKFYIFIPLFFQFFAIKTYPYFYNLYKKTYYFSFKVNDQSPNKYTDFLNINKQYGHIKTIQTKYQEIDLVQSQNFKNTKFNNDYTLYLDRKPQFSIENVVVYHQSFAHVPFHLTKTSPQKILILGGGDGLLAKELLRYPEVKEIKIIELDEKIIKLAKEDYKILTSNSNSLENSKVTVILDNALAYIRNLPKNSADAIFIDFPYPNNYELLKLYSYEFYKEVYRVLSLNGFAVLDAPVVSFDFPIIKDNEFIYLFFNTITKAGFKTIYPYGPSEPFILLTKPKRNFKFDYNKLPDLSASWTQD